MFKYLLTVLCCTLLVAAASGLQCAVAQPAAVDTAREFLPGIVSTGESFGVSLTPDGKQAFFTKVWRGRQRMEIWTTRKTGKTWTSSERLNFDGMGTDIDPVVTPDGKHILYQKRVPRRDGKGNTFNIYWLERTQDGHWRPADGKLFDAVNSDSGESYVTMARNGNIYFTGKRADRRGRSDIYRADLKNGVYQTPANLGSPVNTDGGEGNPCISEDERLLIFAADGPGDFDGDLFLSLRQPDGTWGKPQRLPEGLVNTKYAEFTPYISHDGKTFYFSRIYRMKGSAFGSPADEKIFAIPMKTLFKAMGIKR